MLLGSRWVWLLTALVGKVMHLVMSVHPLVCFHSVLNQLTYFACTWEGLKVIVKGQCGNVCATVCKYKLRHRMNITMLHPFNGLFSTTTWVSWYQEGEASLDLNEARGDEVLGCSGISWTICKQSAPCSMQIAIPAHLMRIVVSLHCDVISCWLTQCRAAEASGAFQCVWAW